MPGLLFKEAPSVVAASPNRADIVCFVGYVARRPTPVPAPARRWLQNQGWREQAVPVADLDPLLDTPVPLESFAAFDQLFAWETRPPDAMGFRHATWLGAAVRSFFRQGGARCFVVRSGDPWTPAPLPANASPATLAAAAATRLVRLRLLFPGYSGTSFPSLQRRDTWRGHGVLLGLAEATTLCFPDLPEIVADATLQPTGLAPLPPSPEVFVECAPEVRPAPDEVRHISPSPACTTAGYIQWCAVVRTAALFLRDPRNQRRDAQLLLALPLPAPGSDGELMRLLDDPMQLHGLAQTTDMPAGIASAFVQLAYPWLVTPGAESLPGGLEPPDGVFAGVLARTVPALGVGHSLGAQPLRGVFDFAPALAATALQLDPAPGARRALIERVSLLGRTPDGPRVLSDVTTSLVARHRPACVSRLTAAILRAARHLGDSLIFEPSGELLWREIQGQLERLLADFYAAGALSGASAAEAYTVRCDATTTSQNDLDNGRVLAEVRFVPSHPIGLITVVLALREGQVAALQSPA